MFKIVFGLVRVCIWGNQLRYPARENDLRERIPHTRPSSHEKYFQSILGSVSYCVVILRTPTYWSVRMVSCNFKLGGVNHFTADDLQTWCYFRRQVKRFLCGKIWPE